MYYLQSRYYDPELGRFINADIFVSTGQGLLGNNMFAYCNNSPIVYKDSEGYFLCTALGAIAGGVSAWIWGTLEGKTGTELDAYVLSCFASGAISGIAGDVLLVTGGSTVVVVTVMAVAGAVGSIVGNTVEARETGVTKAPSEVLIDAVWDAGFGALFGYMGGEIASGFSTIADYGWKYFANRLLENELSTFGAGFTRELVSNWTASTIRASVELYTGLFMVAHE